LSNDDRSAGMAVTVGIGRDLRSTLGSTGNDADGAAVLVVALASTTDGPHAVISTWL